MKIIYFFFFSAFFSNAVADWKEINRDDEKIYFVETDMIIPHLEGRRMAKELHELFNTLDDGTTSLRIRSEYNCKTGATRILTMDSVAGEMGVGKIVALQDKPTDWKLVKSGDSRLKILNFVCEQ